MPSEETKVSGAPSHAPLRSYSLSLLQERIIKAIELRRTIVHYGWIPFIIYISYTRSNP
ncbi:hypothetical protein DAEQUDRAFT_680822 [Daedalea quercina L-15889]|uniref:Tom7-domain-containing protein n=1 Tax=Daedalea quercina L-15889 TaxID=1314783 RepID=A0A165KIJ6_9APHY|nr:hypothetical protein DAEQUDRAFT_680822 [Daedalea quercina L-15889]